MSSQEQLRFVRDQEAKRYHAEGHMQYACLVWVGTFIFASMAFVLTCI